MHQKFGLTPLCAPYEITNPLKLNELKGPYGAQNRTTDIAF